MAPEKARAGLCVLSRTAIHNSMQYLFIHGSWHGAWAWQKLIPHIESKGHKTICIDLPGSGSDADNAENITYQEVYDYVWDTIDGLKEPAIIVAHSSAGLITAQIAEALHNKVAHAYYLAAWLPRDGYSLIDLSVAHNKSEFYTCFNKDNIKQTVGLNMPSAAEFLYHDCDVDDAKWAAAKVRPKSIRLDIEKMPPVIPVNSLPKSTYVLCENDRVVHHLCQLDMAERFGFRAHQIKRLALGHSSFLAQPAAVADLLCSTD